ncbi:MAG TPA: metallophosphoesterase [Polyangia bacterium]|nr:metallophosphoesterase [Polyangia bacterium]
MTVSCGDDIGGKPPVPPESFTVVVLPDTQYYAAVFHDIFPAQTQWIVGHRDEQQIAFVIHAGDIVDKDDPDQWAVASPALRALDGVVPYVVTAGNHDYTNLATRMGMINTYFPPAAFAATSWFGGTYEEGHIENNFSIVAAGGRSWLLMSLEFGPRDEVVAWANQVLKSHADKEAIIVTHAYLYGNDRYDFLAHPEQVWSPHTYLMVDQPDSTINDGEELFRKLIEPNSNVRFVLSGHVITPGAGRLTSTRADGTHVHQILANYQSCDYACEFANGKKVNGGNGYLRLMRFDPTAHQVSVSTYSPYLDRYLDDADNEFTLPWDN